MLVWLPHEIGLSLMGEIPPGVELEVWDGTGGPDDLPPSAADVEIFVPPFLSSGSAVDVMAKLPGLRLVQLLSAGADAYAGKVPPGVVLCDAQGVHTSPTAEWAAAVILAAVRELPGFVRTQDEGRWDQHQTQELAGKTVLIVGYGDIGAAIEARLAPFDVSFLRVARTARPTDQVAGIDQLPALLGQADIVVVIVPLTDATRGMVDAAFLAAMRNGALLVNAARGPVVVTDALVDALNAGRVRAALDVTDPEPLPAGHPLWSCPGLLLTPHVGGAVPGTLKRAYALVGEQVRRYAAGEPLKGVVGAEGY